jgi:hypothetical protein
MVRNSVWALLLVAIGATAASAQTVQTDPLQCWWRTSAGAVRVGEPFTLVLTCAVLETDEATVVVDQTRLEPAVVQFAPFEVLGGPPHGADLRTDQRRFFQYEYRLRLIADGMFGRDVALPEMKISYRVQSKVGQKTSLQGRDQAYVLPAQSIRVLSLVPSDATDIRDASSGETFSDLDQRAFRANLFTVVSGVLFVLAGLTAVLALVRLFQRYRKPVVASARLISDTAILNGVGRELSAVQRERESGRWTPELASRALGALRVVATYAIGRPVSQMPASRLLADGGETAEPGRLILKAGWPRGKRIAVSGAVTPQTVTRMLARPGNTAAHAALLETVSRALASMTAATFGRDATFDESALDEALATSKTVLRRMKFEQLWFMKRLAVRRAGTPMDNRVWSR